MTSETIRQTELKCILDGHVLEPSDTSGEPSLRCPVCSGAWLTPEALHAIEDKSFSADMVKGQMRYGEHPSGHACPHCGKEMERFRYRGFNLELEACPEDAGFWLDHGEDREIQNVMKTRTRNLRRSASAQRDFRDWRRGGGQSFMDKLRNLFRR